MYYTLKQFLNYILILFVMAFALNCADSKQENKNEDNKNNAENLTSDTPEIFAPNNDPSARRNDETPEDYQLRIAGENNVKKRTTVNYLYDLNGNLMDEGGIAEEVEFDKKGRRLTHTVYRGIDKINYTWKFKYDDNDNLIEFESFDRNNVLQLKRNMTYNEAGKLIESKEIYTTKMNEINYIYNYNDEGLLINTIGTSSKGEKSSEKKEYNSEGKVSKIILIDQNGSVTAERTMQYNISGNISKEILKYPNQPEQVTTYGYNGYYANEIITPLQKKVFEYNKNGNVTVDMMFNSAGGRQHKYIIEYDEKGLMIKKTRYDGKDKPALIIEYEYEFYK